MEPQAAVRLASPGTAGQQTGESRAITAERRDDLRRESCRSCGHVFSGRTSGRFGGWAAPYASSCSTTSRRASSPRTSTTPRSIRSTAMCSPTTGSSPCRVASETPIARARSKPPSATPRRRRYAGSASSNLTTPRPTSTAGSGAGPTPASTARPSGRSPPCLPRNGRPSDPCRSSRSATTSTATAPCIWTAASRSRPPTTGRRHPPAFNLRNDVMIAKHVHATVIGALHAYGRDASRTEGERGAIRDVLHRCLPRRVEPYRFEDGEVRRSNRIARSALGCSTAVTRSSKSPRTSWTTNTRWRVTSGGSRAT